MCENMHLEADWWQKCRQCDKVKQVVRSVAMNQQSVCSSPRFYRTLTCRKVKGVIISLLFPAALVSFLQPLCTTTCAGMALLTWFPRVDPVWRQTISVRHWFHCFTFVFAVCWRSYTHSAGWWNTGLKHQGKGDESSALWLLTSQVHRLVSGSHSIILSCSRQLLCSYLAGEGLETNEV